MPTLADLARMRFRPSGAVGTVPAGTGGIKPAPGQTPPIQTQYGGAKWPDFSGGMQNLPAYQNMYQGGNLQNDGSFPRYEASTPMNTAGQGSPLTMNANGIAPPANTAQGMPGGLGGMQGGFGGLFGNLGGGNFLGGRQHGMQPGSYGRASNPNRAAATANGPMGGTPGNPGVAAPTMAEAIAGGMANGWDAASGTPSGSWAQILMGNNAQQALASMTPEQLASWKQYANAQVANANSNYGTAMTNGAFSPGTLAWNRDNILNSFKGWY